MPKKYIYNPLTGITIGGKIFREYGIFTLKQIYNNVTDFEMQSEYYFKIPAGAVLQNFKIVTVNDDYERSLLFSQIAETAEVQRLFSATIERGDLSVVLQTLKNNTYKITVGRQQIAARTEIHVTFCQQLSGEPATKLQIPLSIDERDIPAGVECEFADEVDYTALLDLEIVDNADVARISSSSHEISISEDGKFTTLNFAGGKIAPVGDLEINVEYSRTPETLRISQDSDGNFLQEIRIDGEVAGLARCKTLEFLHHAAKIHKMEVVLPLLSPDNQAKMKTKILTTALEHKILCSQTSLFAEVENERETAEVPALHEFVVPIQKRAFVCEQADELAAFIKDERSFELFVGKMLSSLVNFFVKYLAEGGEFLPEIKVGFTYLMDNFVISGEQAEVVRKILENDKTPESVAVMENFANLNNSEMYEYLYAVKILVTN